MSLALMLPSLRTGAFALLEVITRRAEADLKAGKCLSFLANVRKTHDVILAQRNA